LSIWRGQLLSIWRGQLLSSRASSRGCRGIASGVDQARIAARGRSAAGGVSPFAGGRARPSPVEDERASAIVKLRSMLVTLAGCGLGLDLTPLSRLPREILCAWNGPLAYLTHSARQSPAAAGDHSYQGWITSTSLGAWKGDIIVRVLADRQVSGASLLGLGSPADRLPPTLKPTQTPGDEPQSED
jgi:hypothetical protein